MTRRELQQVDKYVKARLGKAYEVKEDNGLFQIIKGNEIICQHYALNGIKAFLSGYNEAYRQQVFRF